jgi:hypothetical protein
MVTGDRQVPASLVSAVRRDLRPVRPLAAPLRRALALLPIGLALLVGVPAVWGWRANLSALGPAAACGLSGLQTLAGLLIVGAALREAVPGDELSAPPRLQLTTCSPKRWRFAPCTRCWRL